MRKLQIVTETSPSTKLPEGNSPMKQQTLAAFLMTGAIFAAVISFLLGMPDVNP
jgi:hypothetical protein